MKPYSVILYYNYTPIPSVEAYREKQHVFCIENNLLGRIIVASEGINGTVSGYTEDCQKYMNWLENDPLFANTTFDFKVEQCQAHVFSKLHVRVKEEIVNSDLGVDPSVRTGIHLEPSEFKEMYMNDSEVVLVDMRSNYEHSIGKFKGAITFDMDNLRELPDHIEEIEHLKGKKIITYCTGGIKCEKASAYLLERGFENVYQLHGGIIKYGIEQGGEDFEGKCYVFDTRLTTDVNAVNPVVISACHICRTTSDFMVNCANPDCNAHVIICPKCLLEMDGACSIECKSHPRKRPYNPQGLYARNTDNYTAQFGFKSRQRTKTVINL